MSRRHRIVRHRIDGDGVEQRRCQAVVEATLTPPVGAALLPRRCERRTAAAAGVA